MTIEKINFDDVETLYELGYKVRHVVDKSNFYKIFWVTTNGEIYLIFDIQSINDKDLENYNNVFFKVIINENNEKNEKKIINYSLKDIKNCFDQSDIFFPFHRKLASVLEKIIPHDIDGLGKKQSIIKIKENLAVFDPAVCPFTFSPILFPAVSDYGTLYESYMVRKYVIVASETAKDAIARENLTSNQIFFDTVYYQLIRLQNQALKEMKATQLDLTAEYFVKFASVLSEKKEIKNHIDKIKKEIIQDPHEKLRELNNTYQTARYKRKALDVSLYIDFIFSIVTFINIVLLICNPHIITDYSYRFFLMVLTGVATVVLSALYKSYDNTVNIQLYDIKRSIQNFEYGFRYNDLILKDVYREEDALLKETKEIEDVFFRIQNALTIPKLQVCQSILPIHKSNNNHESSNQINVIELSEIKRETMPNSLAASIIVNNHYEYPERNADNSDNSINSQAQPNYINNFN